MKNLAHYEAMKKDFKKKNFKDQSVKIMHSNQDSMQKIMNTP